VVVVVVAVVVVVVVVEANGDCGDWLRKRDDHKS
jgi:ABC-type methionine transport system permease subunit